MKKFLLAVCSGLFSLNLAAQTYPSQNIGLVSHLSPQGNVGVGTDGRKYSGCWGWHQANKNREYAIVGSSTGTWFVDITNPSNPVVRDSVSGKYGCTWREIKTYQNYCYVASDDGAPNNFQIIDMSYLPDSVHVVHKGTSYFERGHTIWIDGNKLYVGSETKPGGSFKSMTVYSLANPANPQFLRALNTDAPSIGHVHDMFVKNDTVYASCGNQGLRVFRYDAGANQFISLGTLTSYPGAGYNHSTYITQNSKYLVMCDEVPSALPIKVLDVQNLSNIVTTATMIPFSGTTPHNPYVIGNRWAFVSSYQDGLYLYDISTPSAPTVAGFFDTYPQGGANVGNYGGQDYRGNWGAYPYFPSGAILAVDMQNGIFILQANGLLGSVVGLSENKSALKPVNVFPNPATHALYVQLPDNQTYTLELRNVLGQVIATQTVNDTKEVQLPLVEVADGHYILTITSQNEIISTRKIIVQH